MIWTVRKHLRHFRFIEQSRNNNNNIVIIITLNKNYSMSVVINLYYKLLIIYRYMFQ